MMADHDDNNIEFLFCKAVEQCTTADHFIEAALSSSSSSTTQELLLQTINNLLLIHNNNNNNHHQHGQRLLDDSDNYDETTVPIEGESRGYADDATWILTASFVILTMQSGFGLLEAGSCSPGYEINVMMKNIVDVIFSALAFYLVGYGIAFGQPSNAFMGLGDMPADGGYDEVESGLLYSRYVFQLSFAATATTIVSGCVAMRMRFVVYCIYSFVSTIFYSFAAHWLFTKTGWLNQLGAHDFAGGASVHIFGGINGLVGILFLGPRRGRFDGTRSISDFFPSSPTSQLFGLFMLWWGWIGFNCGSSFGITDDKWVVAIRCAVTTINSTVGGGFVAIIYSLWRTNWRLIIPEHVVNGILGSLVAITPACASVHTFDAFPIGIVGAVVGLGLNTLICHWKLDDPVGAIGVHAGGGVWGMIAVGLFADSKLPGIDVEDGLFRSGSWSLLGHQIVAILSIIGWAATWSSIFFYLVGCGFSRNYKNPRIGLRQNLEEEERGADWYLHGVVDQLALEEHANKTEAMNENDNGNDGISDSELSFTGYNDDDDDDDFDQMDSKEEDDDDSFDIHHQVPPPSPKNNHRKQLLTRKSDMYYRQSLEIDFQTPRTKKGLNLAFLDNSQHNSSSDNNPMSLSGSERSSRSDRGRSSTLSSSDSQHSLSKSKSKSAKNNDDDDDTTRTKNAALGGKQSRTKISATGDIADDEEAGFGSTSPQQQRVESAPPPTNPPSTPSSPPRTSTNSSRTARIASAIDDNSSNNLRRHLRGSNSIDRMLGQSSRRMMVGLGGGGNNERSQRSQQQQRPDENGSGSRMGQRRGALSRQNNSRNISKELRIYR